jgi:hypothetical protein
MESPKDREWFGSDSNENSPNGFLYESFKSLGNPGLVELFKVIEH